ncbi:MAG TPA: S41 family peptidase [Longimicrobiaceae bacterium]
MKLKRTFLGPVLVALVAFISGGWLLQHQVAVANGVDERIFNEILSRVARDYVDEHSQEELYQMAVDGLLYELGDPHTSFMSREAYEDLRVQTTGEYGGLGIQIAERGGWITVIAPLPGTPAERAGLRAGDRIIEVEGKSTEGWSDEDAVKVLRGPKGSPVSIRIARPGVDEPIPFTIVRDEIRVKSVQYAYMLQPGIGIARLNVFAETSTSELQRAIEDLRSQGMKGLILDLRTNPGGLLDQGVQVADLFLEPGQTIVETRGRDPRDNETFTAAKPDLLPGIPMVVLVDEYSASAAEIVAGALQDHDRALVIGSPTFGKGSVQTLFPLSGGNFLKMTTGRWYTPVGRSIQKERRSREQEELTALLEEEAISEEGHPVPAGEAVDTAMRRPYRTDSGRIVYGGGGIVPDLLVKPDTLTEREREFFSTIAKGGSKFNDAIFRYAVDYVREHPELQRGFDVTDAMFEEFYQRLTESGLEVPHEQYVDADRWVRQRLGYEIALAKWGSAVASQRSNADDRVVRTAVDLLRQANSQQALFELVEQRQQQAAR